MTYTRAAVERAMKVQEVILRALSGRHSWLQVADVLTVSARTVRRLRLRYQHVGYDGLFDRRRRRPSLRAVPLPEVQQLLTLYRERYGPRDGHPGLLAHAHDRDVHPARVPANPAVSTDIVDYIACRFPSGSSTCA